MPSTNWKTKQIIFNNGVSEEIIVARELTFAEYEEYTAMLRDRGEKNFDQQTINIMVRFAEYPDGNVKGHRRFDNNHSLESMNAKTVLATAYAFGYAIAELNTISQADADAMRKN